MRLGDLDALKKEVENLVVGGEKGLKDYYENGSKSDENAWIGGVYDAWELIDNAPTVKPYCYFCGQKEHGIRPQITVCCENADEKTIEELKAELERVINEGRPQGEQIAWEQGYECGKNESRPQGEWVVVYEENNIKTCKCSKCGRIEDIVDFDKYPFCHCGADMRKGGAEE